MTGDPPQKVYLVRPCGLLASRPLTPGIRLRVELAQLVGDDKVLRAHFVGRATVRDGGELALSITEASEAGRQAAAMLDGDMVDVLLWGSRPTIRLR